MVTRAVGCGVTTILPSSPSHVSPSANIRHGHPTSDGDDFGRPTKRPRVNPLDIVKDVSPSRCHALLKGDAVQSKTASGKDEKAMMEDLMAGLDASVFENFETSPVKALWTTKPMRSPLKAKREVVSPSKTPKSPIQQTTPSTTRKSNAFRRTVSIQTDLKVEDLGATDFIFEKAASKNIIFEEDHFDFESDLADLSAFDDDLLLKPRSIDVSLCLVPC